MPQRLKFHRSRASSPGVALSAMENY